MNLRPFSRKTAVGDVSLNGQHSNVSSKMDNIIIRDERNSDIDVISDITAAAFHDHPHSQHTEQFVIEALRRAGALTISLVAQWGDEVVGHVAFSPVIMSDGSREWYGLGPVSVAPAHQRQGIGQALLLEGLRLLRARGAQGCVLVGEPGYYHRFGFRRLPNLGVDDVPAKYVLALPLGTDEPSGTAVFHAAFATRG